MAPTLFTKRAGAAAGLERALPLAYWVPLQSRAMRNLATMIATTATGATNAVATVGDVGAATAKAVPAGNMTTAANIAQLDGVPAPPQKSHVDDPRVHPLQRRVA